jgi:hypothetical protein
MEDCTQGMQAPRFSRNDTFWILVPRLRGNDKRKTPDVTKHSLGHRYRG